MMVSLFVSQALKFFFLLTPFFGLSMFISMTSGYTRRERTSLALRVAFAAVGCIGLMLLVAALLEHWLGRRGLGILMRLTALILAALSAQMIMMGVQAFLKA